MSVAFHIEDDAEAYQCAMSIKEMAVDFGFSRFEAGMLSTAVSEIVINSIRYAKEADVICQYTANQKGIEVRIEDSGSGIKNLQKSLEDGYSSTQTSLGFGLGAAKRSVDEFLINKSDLSGTTITLRKYINNPPYESTPVSVKKEDHEFNCDAYFIKHYNGDESLFAVIEGKAEGFEAYESAQFVKAFLLEHYRLPLDRLLLELQRSLKEYNDSYDASIVLVRLLLQKIEYIIVGEGFITACPHYTFHRYSDYTCRSLPTDIEIGKLEVSEKFCLVLASDGLEYGDLLKKDCFENSTIKLATDIFNRYNIDDDSTLIVIKKE